MTTFILRFGSARRDTARVVKLAMPTARIGAAGENVE